MRKVYLLDGLDCPNCAAKIERNVSAIDGVDTAAASFITQKLTVDISDGKDIGKISDRIVKIARKTDSDIRVKELV